MELTEFLLARIAEDEAPTWELVPYRCEPDCCAPAGWVGHRCLICGTEEFGGTVEAITDMARQHDETIHRRSRVLAECEAKRVTTKWLMTPIELPDEGWQDHADQVFSVYAVTRALEALALPYADHADYDAKWSWL